MNTPETTPQAQPAGQLPALGERLAGAFAFEVVDATDEERYYTLGLFATEADALSVIEGDYPPYSDDNPDSVTVEVRRRPLGFHPHAFDVVASKTWVRYYGHDEAHAEWEVRRPNHSLCDTAHD